MEFVVVFYVRLGGGFERRDGGKFVGVRDVLCYYIVYCVVGEV